MRRTMSSRWWAGMSQGQRWRRLLHGQRSVRWLALQLALARLPWVPLLVCVLIFIGGIYLRYPPNTVLAAENSPQISRGEFVGSTVCAGCHQAQSKAWMGSQHAHAMQAATGAPVLGDFNDAHAQHFSSTARFYRK